MRSKLIPVVLVLLALGAGVLYGTRRPRIGEVAPAGVLQQRHALTAENRPAIRLDPTQVPVELRNLIPLAEQWGIGDDVIRSDVLAKASVEEKRALVKAVSPRYDQINAWLDTFDPDTQQMSDEMAEFMFTAEASEEALAELENP
ncbi:MAG TPA: hypothetical protein VFW08_03050 [bacterium]|nr:hypothetical protein [bacterium]